MAQEISTRDAYGLKLVELGKNNKNIVVLDADLSKSTMTHFFAKEYPERFFVSVNSTPPMIAKRGDGEIGTQKTTRRVVWGPLGFQFPFRVRQ